MRVGQNYFPKSSFLSVEKDLALICNKVLENQRLCKLLYYTDRDCLNKPDLTTEQRMSMINDKILIIPKINITKECPCKLIITLDNFTRNVSNPEFKNNTLDFVALCHPDHWNLGNFSLRPYKIIGEIDSMFNNQKLTGIGTLQFSFCDKLVIDDSQMGLILEYNVIHGEEDKINPLI